jgi:hypothetical protein
MSKANRQCPCAPDRCVRHTYRCLEIADASVDNCSAFAFHGASRLEITPPSKKLRWLFLSVSGFLLALLAASGVIAIRYLSESHAQDLRITKTFSLGNERGLRREYAAVMLYQAGRGIISTSHGLSSGC